MRALVSLYHQSETFITPQTLSKAIDEAFAPVDPLAKIPKFERSYGELKRDVMARRAQPRMVEWDEAATAPTLAESSRVWSDQTTDRERATVEALFGVETNANGMTVPGWDTLEESVELVEREQTLRATRK